MFAHIMQKGLDGGDRRDDEFVVYVRLDSVHTFPVTVQPEWTVAQVKHVISAKQKLSAQDLRIIFSGQMLDNAIKIQDCGIGEQSMLHAVIRQCPLPEVTSSTQHTHLPSDSVLDEGDTTSAAGACISRDSHAATAEKRFQYFVYCKACASIQSGKLRVRCRDCGDGAFLTNRGPSGWDDVLEYRRNRGQQNIGGQCQNKQCTGTSPEFYFKCARPHQETDHGGTVVCSANENVVPLHHIKQNSRLVSCLTCSTVFSPVLVFPCASGHVICLECFAAYGLTQLNNRAFVNVADIGYTLPCPVNCENGYIEEGHHFYLLGQEQYNRYQRFGAEEFVLQNGGVLCPGRGCGAGILPETDDRKVTCLVTAGMGCGHVFCRQCLEDYHEGACGVPLTAALPANAVHVNMDRANDSRWEHTVAADDVTRMVISETTLPCPQCHVATERDGGCMHMTCSRCHFDWCWLCGDKWTHDCISDHWFG